MKRTPYAHIFIIIAFLVNSFGPVPVAQAQEFTLPAPGQMVALSPAFSPAVLKGIKLDARDPFKFHFFVDKGDSGLSVETPLMASLLQKESEKLIKYFLASLTIPEKDLWVNLSPYEKDRIVPQEFGQTEMGRDLLAEDYLLKQITASLIYPESQLGKEFWNKVYAQAQAKYGTTNIPINTFNKVWIIPEKAVVYENGGVAFVLENHLKVMLEQDYLSLYKHLNTIIPSPSEGRVREGGQEVNALGSQIVREIVIPALTKEVNEGKNFSQLRQVFYSLILATWYKKKIKDSILNKVYSDRKKTQGLVIPAKAGIHNKNDVEFIYQQYLQAFKKGVYNYIKEEPDPLTNQPIPRKYFSGGCLLLNVPTKYESPGDVTPKQFAAVVQEERRMVRIDGDAAMSHDIAPDKIPPADRGKSRRSVDGAMTSKLILDKNATVENIALKLTAIKRAQRYEIASKIKQTINQKGSTLTWQDLIDVTKLRENQLTGVFELPVPGQTIKISRRSLIVGGGLVLGALALGWYSILRPSYHFIEDLHIPPETVNEISKYNDEVSNNPSLDGQYKAYMESVFKNEDYLITPEIQYYEWLKKQITQGRNIPAIAIEATPQELSEIQAGTKRSMDLINKIFPRIWPDSYQDKIYKMSIYFNGPEFMLLNEGILPLEKIAPIDDKDLKDNILQGITLRDQFIQEGFPKEKKAVIALNNLMNATMFNFRLPDQQETQEAVNAFSPANRIEVQQNISTLIRGQQKILQLLIERAQIFAANCMKLPKGSIIHVGKNDVKIIDEVFSQKGIRATKGTNSNPDWAMNSNANEFRKLFSALGILGQIDLDNKLDALLGFHHNEMFQSAAGDNIAGEATINVPSSYRSIRNVLNELKLTENDVVYDLGSANGRVVLTTALTTPARKVVGIEIVKSRVIRAIQAAEELGLNQVAFRHADLKALSEDDLKDATVFYLFDPFSTAPQQADKVLALLEELAKHKHFRLVSIGPKDTGTLNNKISKMLHLKVAQVYMRNPQPFVIFESVPDILQRGDRAMNVDPEPQMKQNNAYAERLQKLMERATAESIRRRDILNQAAPQLENYLRHYYGDDSIKIAVVPAGSTLRGYASTDSDLEYDVMILASKKLPSEISMEDCRYHFNPFFRSSILNIDEHINFDDHFMMWIENIDTLIDHPEKYFERRDRVPYIFEKLFAPIAYGDPELIERARKNAIAWMRTHSSLWPELQRDYARNIIFSESNLAFKPHLKQWIIDQGLQENGAQEQLKSELGLPSLDVMSEIYPANPAQMTELGKGGIDLNPAQMTMQVKKEGNDFKFDFNGTQIDAAQVTGATFTIRTVTPVTNLPLILGLTPPEKTEALAKA